jgi:hypothetical protein
LSSTACEVPGAARMGMMGSSWGARLEAKVLPRPPSLPHEDATVGVRARSHHATTPTVLQWVVQGLPEAPSRARRAASHLAGVTSSHRCTATLKCVAARAFAAARLTASSLALRVVHAVTRRVTGSSCSITGTWIGAWGSC